MPATLELKATSAVGEHPNAMVQSSDGARLFVACANTNAVWVVDLADAHRATEQIGVALFPNAPPGTTPNALALSPDGKTLLVANADNNTVAVVDVAARRREPGPRLHSRPAGIRPASLFDRDGRRHLRPQRQGAVAGRQPARPAAGHRPAPTASTSATLLQGALSEIARAGRRRSSRR